MVLETRGTTVDENQTATPALKVMALKRPVTVIDNSREALIYSSLRAWRGNPMLWNQ